MKFIKELRKKDQESAQDSIRLHLHNALANKQKARPTKRVHASEMWKSDMFGQSGEFCPREYALLDILEKRRPDEYIKTCSQMVFHFGHHVADIVIQALAEKGKAVGHWKCQYCEHLYKFQKRPRECSECEHDKFDYIECRFKSKETDMSCGVDLLVPTLSGKHRIVELKSIKDEEFKKLEAPLQEHKRRTNLYMRIVEDSKGTRSKKINTQEAVVLYVSKGGYGCKDSNLHKEGITDGPFSPFKEFLVKRDDTVTQVKWEHTRTLKEWREGKRPMMKGLCPTRVCGRAQSCSVVEACFSGKWQGE